MPGFQSSSAVVAGAFLAAGAGAGVGTGAGAGAGAGAIAVCTTHSEVPVLASNQY